MSLQLSEEKSQYIVPDFLTQDLRMKGAKLDKTPKEESSKRLDGVMQELCGIVADLQKDVQELNVDKLDLANQVRALKADKREMMDQLRILNKKLDAYKEHCAAMITSQLRFQEDINGPYVDYETE